MSADDKKRRAAEHAVMLIEDGMCVGLGTGSTANHAVIALGARIKAEGLRVRCVPTSNATRALAQQHGVALLSFDDVTTLDLCFDGADEADRDLNLTKGGGGALWREKVTASVSKRFYCIVDDSKLVTKLHAFPLPVEVMPFAVKVVQRAIERLGGAPLLRRVGEQPYLTDNGLMILDCAFAPIADPPALADALSRIVGVAEHGLFCGMVHALIVGTDTGVDVIDAV